MHASDHLIDAYVAGLDLVPVEMAITAAGAAIGAPPIAGAIQSQSAVLYCMRQANVERLMERVRSEFADVPTRATLPGLISAMLSSAALFGVTLMTEPEVRLLASEAVLQMETELTELQPAGGLSASIDQCRTTPQPQRYQRGRKQCSGGWQAVLRVAGGIAL
jgi:hypothetical protein